MISVIYFTPRHVTFLGMKIDRKAGTVVDETLDTRLCVGTFRVITCCGAPGNEQHMMQKAMQKPTEFSDPHYAPSGRGTSRVK